MEAQVQLHLHNFSAFCQFAESETKTTRLISEYHSQDLEDTPLRYLVTGSIEEGFPDIESDVDWMIILNGDKELSEEIQTKYLHPLQEAPVHLTIKTSIGGNNDAFVESFSDKSLLRELIVDDKDTKYISAEKARKLNQHDFMPEILWNDTPAYSKDFASGDDSVTSPSYSLKSQTLNSITCDRVPALKCNGWPTEMEEWLGRPKRYWPNQETIEEIQGMGFCLVPKPSGIKGDIEKEWRFSFSLAEAKLFKTFSENQKKVYYMLRAIYVRYLKVAFDKKAISSYHVKTAMFWTMEKQAPSYWYENEISFIVVDIFTELSENLTEGYQPHYFSPKHNLLFNESRNDLDVAAAAIKTMIQDFENVLIQMSRTGTLGLLPRYGVIECQVTAGINEQILELPLDQAYKVMLEKSTEVHKIRKKMKSESLLMCLDKIVSSLEVLPTSPQLIEIYLPLIMCGYQYMHGFSRSTAGKLEFETAKVRKLDSKFQEIDISKMNGIVVFCSRLFKHCIQIGSEDELSQLIQQPFLYLLKLFPSGLHSLDLTETVPSTLLMFRDVCEVFANHFLSNNVANEMATLYENLVCTCRNYKSSLKTTDEGKFDERVLFMLVGGVYLQTQ